MKRVCWTLLVCCLVLRLYFDTASDLHAQKQPSTRKAQRARRPVAPAPIAKPKVKPPELPPIATTPQVPLASLQSSTLR